MSDQFPPEPQYPGQQPWQHQPSQQPQYPGQPPWQHQPSGQTWPGGQQPPPVGPPPRRKHGLRNILILTPVFLLIVLVIAGALGAGGSHKNHHPAASNPSTAAPVAVTPVLTAAEQKFLTEVNSDTKITVTGPNSALLAIGHAVCTLEKSGSTSAAVSSLQGKMSAASAKEFVKVSERDLCPSAKPHVIARFSGSGIENTAKFTIGGSGNWVLKWSFDCASNFGQSGNFIVDEDGGSDFSGASVNELSKGGHGETHVYNDAGRHYLSLNSECSWKVSVVQ